MERTVSIARRVAAIALAACCGIAFYFFCVLPYRCNRLQKAGIASTAFAYEHMGTAEGSVQARRNLAALDPCMGLTCRDVTSDMLAAANYSVLGRYDEAIRLYRDALRLDVRPEIYMNLAAAEVAAGDRKSARNDLLRAVLFSPWAIKAIDDGLLREEVLQQLVALRPENKEYIYYVNNVQLP
jgi:Flp pilus assembly protein TadD